MCLFTCFSKLLNSRGTHRVFDHMSGHCSTLLLCACAHIAYKFRESRPKIISSPKTPPFAPPPHPTLPPPVPSWAPGPRRLQVAMLQNSERHRSSDHRQFTCNTAYRHCRHKSERSPHPCKCPIKDIRDHRPHAQPSPQDLVRVVA